jgi:hypothetical protein
MVDHDEKKAILDASWIAGVRSVAGTHDPDLYHLIAQCYAPVCVIIDAEYQGDASSHRCESSKSLVSEKETQVFVTQYGNKLRKIFNHLREGKRKKHHKDIVLLTIAQKFAGSTILACDGKVLAACRVLRIDRYCLKASLLRCDECVGEGCIFGDDRYNTEPLLNNARRDPCMDFGNDDWCRDCGNSLCDF